MKKILITALVTAAMGSLAQAGSISLDTRTDIESKNFNDAYNTRGYSRIDLQTLRVDAKGNFSDATSFRLRFLLNKSAYNNATNTLNTQPLADYPVNAKDNLSDRINFAYVQQKLGDNLSLQLGKLFFDIGGIEGGTSGADLYFTSYAFNEQSILRYATGAKLIYMMGDQEFNVSAVNQQTDAATTPVTIPTPTPATLPLNFDQNHQAFGLVYKGSFLDKTLLPIVSYHTDSVQSTDAAPYVAGKTTSSLDKKYDYYTVGLKYDFNPMFVELDYVLNNLKSKTVDGETDATSTLVGTLGYKMENWVAKLKYETTTAQVATGVGASRKDQVNAYQIAAEYMPTGDKNLRYHFAYVSRDTKPDIAGVGTKTDQTALVGVRLLADFLK